MATVESMPKSGYTMREGIVSKILVNVGDQVVPGTALLEYETDKLTGTVEATNGGTVLKLLVREGESRPVLAPLVILGEPGEDISQYLDETGEAPREEPAPPPAAQRQRPFASPLARRLARERSIDLSAVQGSGPGGRIQGKDVLSAGGRKATHLAKKAAERGGMDISQIEGSGSGGRITKADVLAAQNAVQEAPQNRERLSGMRKTIAVRLLESKRTIPHAYYTRDIHVDRLAELRRETGLTYNDIILFAVSRALKCFPLLTAELGDGEILYRDGVDLGMAVSVEGGLVVPVIRHAEKLSLRELSQEAARLASLARAGKLSGEDMSGGRFTVSNLGKYGLREFAAIINPPETGILAVGAVEDRVYAEDGKVRIGKEMTVTLSADHRLIDGAAAAEFLGRLAEFLCDPWKMLM